MTALTFNYMGLENYRNSYANQKCVFIHTSSYNIYILAPYVTWVQAIFKWRQTPLVSFPLRSYEVRRHTVLLDKEPTANQCYEQHLCCAPNQCWLAPGKRRLQQDSRSCWPTRTWAWGISGAAGQWCFWSRWPASPSACTAGHPAGHTQTPGTVVSRKRLLYRGSVQHQVHLAIHRFNSCFITANDYYDEY